MLPFIIAKGQVVDKSTGFQQESLGFTGKLNESEKKVYVMIGHHRNITLCHLQRGLQAEPG